MKATSERIAWDSVVAIDVLQRRQGRFEFIEPILRDAAAGRVLIVMSTMVRAETVRSGRPDVMPDDESRLIKEFFENDYFEFEGVHYSIAEHAAVLQGRHRLTSVDAVHIATAVLTRCPILLTNDGEGKSKRKPILPLSGLISSRDASVPALRILTPEQYHRERLAAEAPLLSAGDPGPDA